MKSMIDIFNVKAKSDMIELIMDVSYQQREEAKTFKLRWNPENKYWYCCLNVDMSIKEVCKCGLFQRFKIKKIIHIDNNEMEEKYKESKKLEIKKIKKDYKFICDEIYDTYNNEWNVYHRKIKEHREALDGMYDF